MLSRDEILDRMGRELFSRRHRFFEILSSYATRPVAYPDGEKMETFRWPDVLIVITLEEWNAAYRGASQMTGSRPPVSAGAANDR